MTHWTLSLPADFDYAYCLRYLNRSPLEKLHRVVGERVEKLFVLAGEPIRLELWEDAGQLQIRCEEVLSSGQQTTLSGYLEEWWDLGRELRPFYQLAERDDLLRPVVLARKGLRLIGVLDLFEAICWSILGQQINLPFAYQLKGRLVERYGVEDDKGDGLWVFPEPERIAAATVAELHTLKITRRKCEYLIGMAEAVASGKLSKAQLLAMDSLEKAAKHLISFRGIGPWSAHYVLMRCLRYGEAYPVGDAGLQNAVRKQLQMDRKPTEAELWELAKDWGAWKSYATFYLWQSL